MDSDDELKTQRELGGDDTREVSSPKKAPSLGSRTLRWLKEYAYADGHRFTRNIVLEESSATAFVADHPTDCYETIYSFSAYRVYMDEEGHDHIEIVGPVRAPFYVDLDKDDPAGDITQPLAEARVLVKELLKVSVPEKSIAVYFSGKKGFHILVHASAFNMEEGSEKLPAYYREFQRLLARQLNLKLIDARCYHANRLWRIPNSIHSDTGLYKTRLTPKELLSLSPSEIMQLAKTTRSDPALEPSAVRVRMEIFEEARKAVEERDSIYAEIPEKEQEARREALKGEKPCVADIERGMDEGFRNESLYVLTVDHQLRGMGEADALNVLLEWNRRNRPPLPDGTIAEAVHRIYSRQYGWSCRKARDLGVECETGRCCLYRRREGAGDPEAEQAAEALLENSNLIEETKTILDEEIVREVRNKLLVFLLCLSGKRKAAKEKQLIILKGAAGGGKTIVANTCSKPFKTRKRGRLSAHALDYSDLTQHEVLYLQELFAVDKDEYAPTIRFLSADDEGYTVEVAVRGADGKFTTVEHKVPPITVITTTTRVEVEEQFQRRAWIVNIDETPDQTNAILDWKVEREAGLLDELLGKTTPKKGQQILAAAVRKLEDYTVVITTPKSLRHVIPRSGAIRVRGDYDKLVELVRLLAFWHQRQRPKAILPDGRRILFTLPQDAAYAIEIAKNALASMTSGLEERIRRAGPEIERLSQGTTTIHNEAFAGFSVSDLTKALRTRKNDARKILDALVDAGMLEVSTPKGNAYVYNLLISRQEFEQRLSLEVPGLGTNISASDFEKEAESVLDRCMRNGLIGTVPPLSIKAPRFNDDEYTHPLETISALSDKKEPEIQVPRAGMPISTLLPGDLGIPKLPLMTKKAEGGESGG